MALDGITLSYLTAELAPQLVGARIDKILQPEKDEIHLVLRRQGTSLRLVLNAGSTGARLHLTGRSKKNPASPPMFCMILRKHLEGGKILELRQLGLERIVTLSIQNYNEYGDLATLHLTLEIMGKHSNLLLVDPGTGQILDGIRRYSHALSRHREVLPGRPYLLPPSQGKIDATDEETFRETLLAGDLEGKLSDLLLAHFDGLGPELALEIVLASGLDGKTRLGECGEIDLVRLYQTYTRLGRKQGTHPDPRIYYRFRGDHTPAVFTFVPYEQYEGLPSTVLTSVDETVARFFETRSGQNALAAQRGSLLKLVREIRSHVSKKLSIYEETLGSARTSFKYRLWGELLTANVYRVQPGMAEVEVEDYHEEEQPLVRIPLDPALNAIDNAQRYYKLYNKAKAALQKTEPLRQTALADLSYLESVLLSLEQAESPADLEEVHTELVEQKYLSGKALTREGKKKSANKKTGPEIKPRSFRSSQGRPIWVGKNNRQNDWLTLKRGKPGDLWLHVKNIPGSHVLIPLTGGEEFPDDTTLEEAAALAVYFSQARGSSLVPVDYTHVRQIKKPNSAKPGMVVYEQNWTLFVTPQPEVLAALLQTEDSSPQL
ncbi:hypothetical protein CEB3_c33650 [Peptococcaceae bacterium CEB3]|nr:hypothetical protein CEB3_c33650 [Peptococcaceae bacterium CEB3]